MPLVRFRVPIELYEKLRLEEALRSRTQYRPLDPPPSSGFMETAYELSRPAYLKLKRMVKERRARGENATMSSIIMEVIADAKLSRPEA